MKLDPVIERVRDVRKVIWLGIDNWLVLGDHVLMGNARTGALLVVHGDVPGGAQVALKAAKGGELRVAD